MYVTRPLSMYRREPSNLSIPPPLAPNSGYLTITDAESEEQDTCCWGACKNKQVKKLPFPQNKILTIVHSSSTTEEEDQLAHHHYKVWFVPVFDQPLSSNRYYIIRAAGKHKGKASICTREVDIGAYCCGSYYKDLKPRAFDHRDIYQQVEIHVCHCGFVAKSVAPDGFPPSFLRRKGWQVYASSHCFKLGIVPGLDISLRMRLPEVDFSISNKYSATVVVGKWYCPFMFIKEEVRLRYQMKTSMFYEITLEQWWEEIYACENDGSEGNVVVINVNVQREVSSIFGMEAIKECGVDEVTWFKAYRVANNKRRRVGVGLSSAIVEKMRWLQEKADWVNREEREIRVEKVEVFRGGNRWNKFGCYVLVESFALRRSDGILLLTCDFRHTHHILSKWE
ncbi:uncharacterized protein LOC122065549 [Macadamia integrifolia]|uniref:uncharacterized protein LOC122065549 n=1 Tax=Macadamia integrifolia TaxID=60698 RepID=UPI001C4FF6FD|nr:uncharacterized protein LOC122065549 [Macadamia integrifolia]